MTREERLAEAMSGIGDEMLEEAMGYRRTGAGWLRWTAAAACLALVVGSAVLWQQHQTPTQREPDEQHFPVKDNTGEVAVVEHWETLSVWEQYPSLRWQDREYGLPRSPGLAATAEPAGEPLGSATAAGWDEYADLRGEDARREVTVQLRSITGVSLECAVAARQDVSELWVPYVNQSYRPETLGQFIDDLGLRENLVIRSAFRSWREDSGDTVQATYTVDPAQVWALLLSAREAVNTWSDAAPWPKELLSIGVDVPILGYENVSLSVREGGYIMTNLLDTGKLFCVGEDNTGAFMDYVLTECPCREQRFASVDLPGTPEQAAADGEASTPAYDPAGRGT